MESSGGHVQTAVCPDGTDDVPRVYIKGKKIPGLAMTRAIGDKTALRFLGVVKTDFEISDCFSCWLEKPPGPPRKLRLWRHPDTRRGEDSGAAGTGTFPGCGDRWSMAIP